MQDNEPINLTYGQMSDMVNRIEQIPSLSGEGAPTSDTPAFHLGQTYIDTITGDMYYCSDIFDESGGLPQYTWNLAAEDVPEYVAGDNVTIEDESGALVISATDTTYSNFVGTDGTAAGTAGLVPAPATTDVGKFLKADGTWDSAGGVNVVQTTGTSTTDVMSQNAVTSMVFADPATRYKVRITNDPSAIENNAVAIGRSATNVWENSIGIGYSASASSKESVALGHNARISNALGGIALGAYSRANSQGEMNIGSTNTSYGYNSSNYRLLSGLYDPQSAHDAATKGYCDNAIINGGTTAPTTATVGAVGTQYTYVDTTGTHTAHLCVCTEIDTTDPSTPVYTWQTLI